MEKMWTLCDNCGRVLCKRPGCEVNHYCNCDDGDSIDSIAKTNPSPPTILVKNTDNISDRLLGYINTFARKKSNLNP